MPYDVNAALRQYMTNYDAQHPAGIVSTSQDLGWLSSIYQNQNYSRAATWADVSVQDLVNAGIDPNAVTAGARAASRRAKPTAKPAATPGAGSTASPGYTAPRVDPLTIGEVGWNAAVLKSSPELAALFRRAVAETWSQQKFQAEVRNTQWFKTHQESWRTSEILRLTDPKSYTDQWNKAKQTVIDRAAQLGATINGGALTRAVNQYVRLGWTTEQLDSTLSQYITEVNGAYRGAAGQAVQNLRGIARANGVTYNDKWYGDAARAVSGGARSLQDYENDIRTQAASAFPVFSEQIKAGQNVADIASPYIQRMSALLEINPQQIDLFDNTIREALSGRNPDTGKAQAKSLWQFENDLRNDPRWQKTQNAKETYSNAAENILKTWGLI